MNVEEMFKKVYIFFIVIVMFTSIIKASTGNEVDNDHLYTILTDLGWKDSDDEDRKEIYSKLESLIQSKSDNTEALRDNYESAKANEQSLANRTLTATTIAATGIGGMELMEGLASKKADAAADADMEAYLQTFRCTYGDGHSVKGGAEAIELPGGNDEKLMKLRNEYIALAADLKERKTSLGMKPGIESEEIKDKAEMGLYDDESTGITDGAYASLYRAKALNSEKDQQKIDEEKSKADKRIKGGAIAAGIGTVVGIAGNAIINKDVQNNTEQLVLERESIQKEIDEFLQQEIDRCNVLIKNAKDYAQQIAQSEDNMKNDIIKKYVDDIMQLQPLSDKADIDKIKEHPLCK